MTVIGSTTLQRNQQNWGLCIAMAVYRRLPQHNPKPENGPVPKPKLRRFQLTLRTGMPELVNPNLLAGPAVVQGSM